VSEDVVGRVACERRSFHRRTAGIWYHARPSYVEDSSLADESGGVDERQVEDDEQAESARVWCEGMMGAVQVAKAGPANKGF
jgi:hypothetical protein